MQIRIIGYVEEDKTVNQTNIFIQWLKSTINDLIEKIIKVRNKF